THASTSRTSARRKKPGAPPSAASSGAVRETDTIQGYERAGLRARAGQRCRSGRAPPSEKVGANLRAAEATRLRSGGGPDRLARSAADRRAPRRLAAARWRARRIGAAARLRVRATSRRLQRLQTPGELPPIEAVDRSTW